MLGISRGLMQQARSTNYAAELKDFTADAGAAIIDEGIDPAGNAVVLLKEDGSTGSHTAYAYPTDHGVNYGGTLRLTYYAKAAGRTWLNLNIGNSAFDVWVDLQNHVVGTVSKVSGDNPVVMVSDVGGGWNKIVITQTNVPFTAWFGMYTRFYLGNADNSKSYAGDNSSGVELYGLVYYADVQ